MSVFDEIWDRVVGGLDWLKQVVVGEFDDHRDLSAVIADMLVSFVPGVVIVTSARDLTAVTIRLANHPEKREEVTEWMLLIGCVIPLVLPVLAAAVGAAGAGVGAVVGGIAGSEAGAALRATCLLLIREGTALAEVIGFLKKFINGDVMKVLRDIKFAQYGDAIVKYVRKFIDGLIAILRRVRSALESANWFEALSDILARLQSLETRFYAVQQSAVSAVPKALSELDARLQKMLSESVPKDTHAAHTGIPAPKAKPIAPGDGRVPAMSNNPLGTPPGTHPVPSDPGQVPEKPNLHPEKPPQKRRPRRPTKNNTRIDQARTTHNPDGSTTYFDKQGRSVTYNADGYPDFSPYAEAEVKVDGLKGTIPPDDAIANKAVGLDSTPDGYTWHHVEDATTMQLVPTDIHDTFPHTGGASVLRQSNGN